MIESIIEEEMFSCDTFNFSLEIPEENEGQIEVIGRSFSNLDDDWVYAIKPRKVKEAIQRIIDNIDESCIRNVIEKFPYLNEKPREEICHYYLSEELGDFEASNYFEEWNDDLYASEGLMFELSVSIVKQEYSNSGNLEIVIQGLISWDHPAFFWSGREWKTPEYREVITGVRNLEKSVEELCKKAMKQIY